MFGSLLGVSDARTIDLLVASDTLDMANSSLRKDKNENGKIGENITQKKKNVDLEILNRGNMIEEGKDFREKKFKRPNQQEGKEINR